MNIIASNTIDAWKYISSTSVIDIECRKYRTEIPDIIKSDSNQYSISQIFKCMISACINGNIAQCNQFYDDLEESVKEFISSNTFRYLGRDDICDCIMKLTANNDAGALFFINKIGLSSKLFDLKYIKYAVKNRLWNSFHQLLVINDKMNSNMYTLIGHCIRAINAEKFDDDVFDIDKKYDTIEHVREYASQNIIDSTIYVISMFFLDEDRFKQCILGKMVSGSAVDVIIESCSSIIGYLRNMNLFLALWTIDYYNGLNKNDICNH